MGKRKKKKINGVFGSIFYEERGIIFTPGNTRISRFSRLSFFFFLFFYPTLNFKLSFHPIERIIGSAKSDGTTSLTKCKSSLEML